MKALVLLAGLLLPSLAVAGDFGFEFGPDVVHAPGLRAWSASIQNDNSRFRYGQIGQEGVAVQFFGAEYVWRPTSRLSTSFGIIHIERTSEINGLRWNFQLGMRYRLSDKVFIGFIHSSHGRGAGIARDKTNLGFNFLTIGTEF